MSKDIFNSIVFDKKMHNANLPPETDDKFKCKSKKKRKICAKCH